MHFIQRRVKILFLCSYSHSNWNILWWTVCDKASGNEKTSGFNHFFLFCNCYILLLQTYEMCVVCDFRKEMLLDTREMTSNCPGNSLYAESRNRMKFYPQSLIGVSTVYTTIIIWRRGSMHPMATHKKFTYKATLLIGSNSSPVRISWSLRLDPVSQITIQVQLQLNSSTEEFMLEAPPMIQVFDCDSSLLTSVFVDMWNVQQSSNLLPRLLPCAFSSGDKQIK